MKYHSRLVCVGGGGITVDKVGSWGLYFFLGVPLFFFLSGFLIWIAIDRYNNMRGYYINRFLRIYPELWTGVIVEIICIAVLVTPINWRDLILFIGSQATVLQFWTPESLRSFGVGTPNGSLWTICVMIQFYFVIYPLKRICRGKKISFWITIEIILMGVGAATKYVEFFLPEVVYKLYCQTIIQYMWIFWLGMMIAEFKEYILPKLIKFWYIPAVGAIMMRFSPFDVWARGFPIILSCFCLTALLSLAYKLPFLKIKTDVSYALFIYHMIVVNVIIELGFIGNMAAFICCIVISITFALLSTILIGRNVAKLKIQ